jgi:hypothetical protein
MCAPSLRKKMLNSFSPYLPFSLITQLEGQPREKGRVAKEGVGLPSQLERKLQLGWLCPNKIFRHGKKTLFLIMVYSALFNPIPGGY